MFLTDTIARSVFTHTAQGEHGSVVELLRRRIAECELGCMGWEAADKMLDGIGAESERLSQSRGLEEARQMRDAIVSILRRLDELDELEPDEPDRSAFYEVADLFVDLGDIARLGALAVRRAGGYECV
ncbi:MAG: hypothetical protein Q8K28_06735 [Hoeflea sp.]|uniref:hypothetical protein n=1 Tax=Hoeflea sp. TaxID=1940281 RepID=UPI00272F5E8C|nr:hypothetical protein [Hoeflea sp.]MDP2119581.1 hypothetical protein [Hoeflea sp.]